MRTLRLIDSFPAPTELSLDEASWRFFAELPPDLRTLLTLHNGGFAEDGEFSFDTGVPIRTVEGTERIGVDHLRELFGLRGRSEAEGPRDLLDMRAECEGESFLPRGVVPIASCAQGSLVCVSLRPERFGEVLYWDRYWQAPWCHPFFQARLDAILARRPDAPDVLNEPGHPDAPALTDELDFATLMTLAPNVERWVDALRDERRSDWI